MTDEEILMDYFQCTKQEAEKLTSYNKTGIIGSTGRERKVPVILSAYRAGYEKGYDKATDDAAWNYGYFDDDIRDDND